MITLYCGDWEYVPDDIKPHVEVPMLNLVLRTQLEIFNFGALLTARHGRYDVFTNDSNILLGMQVAVKERHKPDNPTDIRIVFYSPAYKDGYHIYIDSDGLCNASPPGFFDQASNALLMLF